MDIRTSHTLSVEIEEEAPKPGTQTTWGSTQLGLSRSQKSHCGAMPAKLAENLPLRCQRMLSPGGRTMLQQLLQSYLKRSQDGVSGAMHTARPSVGVPVELLALGPATTTHCRSRDLQKPWFLDAAEAMCAAGARQWRDRELPHPYEKAPPDQEEKLPPPPLSLQHLFLTKLSIPPAGHSLFAGPISVIMEQAGKCGVGAERTELIVDVSTCCEPGLCSVLRMYSGDQYLLIK